WKIDHEIRRAAGWMTPAAISELRSGRCRTRSLWRASIGPRADLLDLFLAQALVVLEFSVVRIGKPRRHFTRCDLGLDRLRPRPRVLIRQQRHRRDLIGPMTFGAT